MIRKEAIFSDKKNLLNAILREDFNSFITKVFYNLSCGSVFYHAQYIDIISDYLMEVYRGNINRLIINMPPRSLKSVCVSVAFPSWVLGHNHSKKIIGVSYSQSLSNKHSLDCRFIMSSSWYKELFPSLEFDDCQNEKHKFYTTERGCRISTSTGGTLTGEGADIIIVDDPHNAAKIFSSKDRSFTQAWFDSVLMTRLNDINNSAVILVMHRLHSDDLTGYLLGKSKNWKHLSIPFFNDSNKKFYINNHIYNYKKNSNINPNRFSSKNIKLISSEVGCNTFAAQYQQKPFNYNSNIFHSNSFHYYDIKDLPAKGLLIHSWDTANKSDKNSDYSVGTCWIYINNKSYIIDMFRVKLQYAKLREYIYDKYKKYKPDYLLIEDKGSGISIISELTNRNCHIIPIAPREDKLTRLMKVIPIIERGEVLFIKNKSWSIALEQELLGFPNYYHDDIVDSITQYLNWIIIKKVNFRITRL